MTRIFITINKINAQLIEYFKEMLNLPLSVYHRNFNKRSASNKSCKPKDLLLVRTFVHRMKSSECIRVGGQNFEKQQIFDLLYAQRFAACSNICPQNEKR